MNIGICDSKVYFRKFRYSEKKTFTPVALPKSYMPTVIQTSLSEVQTHNPLKPKDYGLSVLERVLPDRSIKACVRRE